MIPCSHNICMVCLLDHEVRWLPVHTIFAWYAYWTMTYHDSLFTQSLHGMFTRPWSTMIPCSHNICMVCLLDHEVPWFPVHTIFAWYVYWTMTYIIPCSQIFAWYVYLTMKYHDSLFTQYLYGLFTEPWSTMIPCSHNMCMVHSVEHIRLPSSPNSCIVSSLEHKYNAHTICMGVLTGPWSTMHIKSGCAQWTMVYHAHTIFMDVHNRSMTYQAHKVWVHSP